MAVQPKPSRHVASSSLDQNQQDLLLAALTSQASNPTAIRQAALRRDTSTSSKSRPKMSVSEENLFMSPQDAELDNFDDFTPELDYLDGDNSFDFDNADLGGEMIGALPGGSESNGEKRKSRDERETTDEGDAKRHETQEGEKSAKKPGRKPLTSEPTTKRKAQNRAAQRAFRERKEKHLKDLESKVTELTKSKEADKHENGLLKAQVERLQTELKEYRKRLSLNSLGGQANRSPPLSAAPNRSNVPLYGGSQFQFDFPKFGNLPGSQIFGHQANGVNAGVLKRGSSVSTSTSQSPRSQQQVNTSSDSRHNSLARSMSPGDVQYNASKGNSPANVSTVNSNSSSNPNVGYSTNSNMHGFASTLPSMGSNSDPLGDLFSPSILKGSTVDGNNFFGDAMLSNGTSGDIHGVHSTAGINRDFQFQSTSSASDSASPSNSSTSQWNAGPNSSCGTSPEPSHDSPGNKDKSADSFVDRGSQLRNSTNASQLGNSTSAFGNADNFSVPSTSTFDPVLFNDYRDPSNDAMLFNTDFTGGFFDEAINPPFDLGSPTNLFGILQSPQQTQQTTPSTQSVNAHKPSDYVKDELNNADTSGGDQNGVAKNHNSGKLINCNNIWNQLQANPDFQEGKFDLDNLCTELRMKARCSESGVMVDADHVDAALRKLGSHATQQKDMKGMETLMFEQESWDNVLKKFSNTS